MAKEKDVGVFEVEKGQWAYRFTYTRNGKRYSKRATKDLLGKPLKTKKEAIKAEKRHLNMNKKFMRRNLSPAKL